MAKIHHVCLSVRAYLDGFDSSLRRLFKHPNGRWFAPREARQLLGEELAKGHTVLPFGPACEGFDYSGNGCPGHPVDGEP